MIPTPTPRPPIVIKRTYLRGFSPPLACLTCGIKTRGRLCDHISGSFGSYYSSGLPICARCYERVKSAVEKAEQLVLEGLR
jgi:hypothetical protein